MYTIYRLLQISVLVLCISMTGIAYAANEYSEKRNGARAATMRAVPHLQERLATGAVATTTKEGFAFGKWVHATSSEAREEIRAQIKARVDAQKLRVTEHVYERFTERLGHIQNLFEGAIARLSDAANKVSVQVDTIEGAGYDMSTSREILDEVRDRIEILTEYTGSLTEEGQYAVTDEKPKEAWEAARADMLEYKEEVRAIRTLLHDAVAEIHAVVGGARGDDASDDNSDSDDSENESDVDSDADIDDDISTSTDDIATSTDTTATTTATSTDTTATTTATSTDV